MISFHNASRITSEMLTEGYSHIPSADIHMSNEVAQDVLALQGAFEHLARDIGNRYRSYARTTMLPTDHEVDLSYGSHAVLGSSYVQSVEHNPEAGGAVRPFSPLDPFVRNNKALRALVAADARVCGMHRIWPNAALMPMQVGVHLIRLDARPGEPGIALPNRPHKDGEFFTFIHLLNRHGVRGGDTEFYANGNDGKPGRLLFKAPLRTTLETVGTFDPLGWHNVTPVEVLDGYTFGYRDVVLVDITPMLPVTVDIRGNALISLPQLTLPDATRFARLAGA